MASAEFPLKAMALWISLRFGHGHQSTHFGTTARLANDSDIVGVSAKLPDIVVYPFQAGDQVENAHIARCFESLTGHRKIGKPDRPQTMIDGYEHDVTITLIFSPL